MLLDDPVSQSNDGLAAGGGGGDVPISRLDRNTQATRQQILFVNILDSSSVVAELEYIPKTRSRTTFRGRFP